MRIVCGIVGIFDALGRREISRSVLFRMNEQQHHRGPDEGGIHIEPGLGLGHRRLSIIDLSGGQQPLFNEDNTVVVTYNGEIYNFQELSIELKSLGHHFRTHCDTEVIVHAWEQWGDACIDRFRGMFAFALWDRNRETLFLARDRLGIKPLHYVRLDDGIFIFASELKSLKEYNNFPTKIDPKAVEEYFTFGYIPDPRTIYKGVKKLPPGHYLKIRRGNKTIKTEQYWDISFQSDFHNNQNSIEHELIERLREAVRIRMISEVPLGAFLSGGVDSSAVVAMMARESENPVNTCCISFDEKKYDESLYASVIAEKYGTNHREDQVNHNDFNLVDKLSTLYDEPFADSSALPTYRVCELAKKYVTVVLSGDGGDENFAGYRRYIWHMKEERLRSFLPKYIRYPLFGILGKVYPRTRWAPRYLRAKSTFESLSRNNIEGYLNIISYLGRDTRRKMFSSKLKRDLQGYDSVEVFKRYLESAPTDQALSLVQYLDLKTYLPGDILTKVDRASMAHALEVRVPVLDHLLVDWVSGLPPALKLKNGEGKYIFKKSLQPFLPKEILYRRKMGFAVPLVNWFRDSLAQKVRDGILGNHISDSGMFNTSYLKAIVTEHQSGKYNHSSSIWALLMFEAFLRNE